MNTPIAALRCLLILLVPIAAYAGSAQWNLNPTSADWNTAGNWTPMTVPNGPADIATLDLSNTTNISISADTEVSGITFTSGATNPYSITVSYDLTLTLSGTGVTNHSGIQHTIVDEGIMDFFNTSTAGDAHITVLSPTQIRFWDNSSAGSAFISGYDSSYIQFFGSSTAGNATIGGLGHVVFYDSSNAGSAFISNAAVPIFQGAISFYGSSQGGTAQIELLFNPSWHTFGFLDISDHDAPGVTIGSIEGDEHTLVFLGANNLTVGSNNLSTTFAGTIQGAGSLEKIGDGTLTLAKNSYQGGTTIQAGILFVANHRGSGTGRGPVSVTIGTLGGSGIIAGATTIGTGSGTGAFLAPSAGMAAPATLTIESALTFKTDGTYIYKLIPKRAKADQVIANGVTIESGAQFDFQAVANKPLTIGTVFMAIDNTSANPIAGTFANLPDGSTFTAGRNTYQVSYEGGDGNDLTLTVMP